VIYSHHTRYPICASEDVYGFLPTPTGQSYYCTACRALGRGKDIDEHARVLTVREAIYDRRFSTPKTEAGRSASLPLSSV
jgi:hypothetical protein